MATVFNRKTISAGLLVGTMDMAAAFVTYYLRTGKNPVTVLLYIASGVFGKEAFTGGQGMALLGLSFHYGIAMTFTFFFFWLTKKFPAISKQKIISGLLYGIFIWSFMQFVTLPLSRVTQPPLTASGAGIGAGVLILCIGIPLAYLAGRPSAASGPQM